MQNRSPVGYVVQIDHGRVTLNLLDKHKGQVAAHQGGVSHVTDIGGVLGIDGGHRMLVLRIASLNFAEPKEVHRQGVGSAAEPLRNLEGIVVGWVERKNGKTVFNTDNLVTPALGAEAFPLSSDEVRSILGGNDPDGVVRLGTEHRTGNPVRVGLNRLLAQHVAVLGASGQGKSCFTASILQQLADFPSARIVVFDINGEYDRAFKKSEDAIKADDTACRLGKELYRHTVIGQPVEGADNYKIPYFALGRHGLHRLLVPSEKTQRPALSFAVDNLRFVEWHGRENGVSLKGQRPTLYDDCRSGGEAEAKSDLDTLRTGGSQVCDQWPHMSSLAALAAESHSLVPGQYKPKRDPFPYGNVAPLITRIHRLVEDEMFKAVVDVEGGGPVTGSTLDWHQESEALVDRIFGEKEASWRVHVVNLRQVPQDLMPMVLGSLLELYAHVLFKRGQGNTEPTLLVLEEAHHYLRPVGNDDEGSHLAYERLAKEGRKFGLSLWLSTQRPSEVSQTVLSQCNNWVSFRLSSEQDQKMISSACEWADSRDVKRIAGLPRQHAMILGGSVAMPMVIKSGNADPTPESHDGKFNEWEKAVDQVAQEQSEGASELEEQPDGDVGDPPDFDVDDIPF